MKTSVSLLLGVALSAAFCGPSRAETPALSFSEFFDTTGQEPAVSGRLLQLNGNRVKLVGFMAKMEVAPRGAFYLTPRPVSCDEEGAGTADLPIEAVYVVVRSSPGLEVPYTPRALEVTGRLDYRGEVITPLDEAGVRESARRLKDKGVEAIAVGPQTGRERGGVRRGDPGSHLGAPACQTCRVAPARRRQGRCRA